MADCRTPGGPRASAGSLVGGIRVQVTPGLLPTHWWVKPNPGASDSLMAGRDGSWGLVPGPGIPELVSHGWCVRLVPDTVGCRVQGVPKLVLACWQAGPGLSQSQGRVWPAGGWARSTGCRTAIVLRLLSAHWYMKQVPKIEQTCWWVGLELTGFWGWCLPTGG